MRLERLTALPHQADALAALEAIFFASTTRTTFASSAERAAFLATWTGWYVAEAPSDIWFALADDRAGDEPDGGAVIGYLTGCKDSAGADALARTIPKYDVFADRFAAYPAHFHVNVRSDRRGHGVGRRLVDRFAEDCRLDGLPGVHLVTGALARNAAFYRRAGFTDALQRGPLLFLGRSLC